MACDSFEDAVADHAESADDAVARAEAVRLRGVGGQQRTPRDAGQGRELRRKRSGNAKWTKWPRWRVVRRWLTEERADDLVVLLAAGVPVKVAARAVNVSRRTLDRWLRQDELRERVKQARAVGPVSTEAVTEARLVVLLARAAQFDWRAAAWWLERRWPERWAER